MELGANFGMFGKPSSWPTGPRIGSLDGATVGICRGLPGSICLFCCHLQPAPRLVIGRSSPLCLWSCCFVLPSLHFQVGCCSCKLPCASFGPAWLRSPRPGPSPPTCACPHSHSYIHTRTRTYTLLESRLTVSDGIYSPAVSRGQSVRSFRSLIPPVRSLARWLEEHRSICCCCSLRSALSSPGLALSGCRPLSACHSRQSFCYIRAVPTSQQPIDLSFSACPLLSLSRFLPPVDPFPSPWSIEVVDGQTDDRGTDTTC